MDNRQGHQDAKKQLLEPSSVLDDFAHRVLGAAIEVHPSIKIVILVPAALGALASLAVRN